MGHPTGARFGTRIDGVFQREAIFARGPVTVTVLGGHGNDRQRRCDGRPHGRQVSAYRQI
jgi:hypothetical protein